MQLTAYVSEREHQNLFWGHLNEHPRLPKSKTEHVKLPEGLFRAVWSSFEDESSFSNKESSFGLSAETGGAVFCEGVAVVLHFDSEQDALDPENEVAVTTTEGVDSEKPVYGDLGKQLVHRFLEPLGLTPESLATSLGLSMKEITPFLQGKVPLTHDLAHRLALFFRVPVRWWLELQAQYDSEDHEKIESLREVVKPYDGLAEILVTPTGVRLLPKESSAKPKVELRSFSKELIERLQAQVKLNPPRGERIVEEVEYDNGAKALIGKDP